MSDAAALAVVDRMRRFAILDAGRTASGTRLRQRGQMWWQPGGASLPFTAGQRIDARALDFRWTARFRIARVLPLTVIDAFERRRGFLEVRPLGIRVSRAEGPDFDEGEAQRFLAELPWCPFALGHPELRWTVEGESNVRVHLGGASVTMHVDAEGRVLRATADRLRTVGGGTERTPWRGVFGDYREFDGMRLPSSAQVFWDRPAGPYEYFRCEVVAARAFA